MFKSGDKVRCVRGLPNIGLMEGAIYTIAVEITSMYLAFQTYTLRVWAGMHPFEHPRLEDLTFAKPQVILVERDAYLLDKDRFVLENDGKS